MHSFSLMGWETSFLLVDSVFVALTSLHESPVVSISMHIFALASAFFIYHVFIEKHLFPDSAKMQEDERKTDDAMDMPITNNASPTFLDWLKEVDKKGKHSHRQMNRVLVLGVELERNEQHLGLEARHRFHVLRNDFDSLLHAFAALKDEDKNKAIPQLLANVDSLSVKFEELLSTLDQSKWNEFDKRSSLIDKR